MPALHRLGERLAREKIPGIGGERQDGEGLPGRERQDAALVPRQGRRGFESAAGPIEIVLRRDDRPEVLDAHEAPALQSEPGFRLQDAADGLVEPLHGQPAVPRRARQMGDDLLRFERQENLIDPGLDGPERRFFRRKRVRDAAHFHGVRHQQALEAHLVAQQPGHDGRRKGRRQARRRVEGRDEEMRGHDRADTRRDGFAEREKLHAVQAGPVSGNGRQADVGILGRIAVAREVLGGGDHPVVLAAANERPREAGDELGRFADGPDVDDGVVGIDVDVHDGRVGLVNAHRPALEGRDPSHPVRQLLRAGSPDRHEGREQGRVRDLVAGPPLEVRGDEKRHFGPGLEEVREVGRLVDFAAEQADPADPGAFDEVAKAPDFRAVEIPEFPDETAADELAGLFLDGHPPQGFLHPAGIHGGQDGLQDRFLPARAREAPQEGDPQDRDQSPRFPAHRSSSSNWGHDTNVFQTSIVSPM